MPLLEDLKWLSRLPPTSSPFLTMYLNTRWDSEKRREEVRIFAKNQIKSHSVEISGSGNGRGKEENEDIEKLDHYVRGLVNREWDEEYAGIALFACSGLGVFRVVRSFTPFEDCFVCAGRPLLRPAAEQVPANEPALMAVVASDGGRVMDFVLGGVRKVFRFRDEEFPGRHEQGGWSQARYQRHVDEHVQRNLKRLVNHLVRWADEQGRAPILLSGSDALLAAFEEFLPKRILGRICARLHVESSASNEDLVQEAGTALLAARNREDAQAVDSVLNTAVGTGRAVVGPEAVAEAVATGKVHRLFLDRRFDEIGWKCCSCGMLGVKASLGCPMCGEAVEGVRLGEEYIRGTLATDGDMISVTEHPGLLREGGVAAQLRY